MPAFAPTLRPLDVPCPPAELVVAIGAAEVVVLAEICVLEVGDEELVDKVWVELVDKVSDEEPSATTNPRLYIPQVPPVAL